MNSPGNAHYHGWYHTEQHADSLRRLKTQNIKIESSCHAVCFVRNQRQVETHNHRQAVRLMLRGYREWNRLLNDFTPSVPCCADRSDRWSFRNSGKHLNLSQPEYAAYSSKIMPYLQLREAAS